MKTHLYYERYVNEGTLPSNANIGFHPQYLNNSDIETFPVLCYRVPQSDIKLRLANPSQEVLDNFVFPDGTVKFYLHPQFENHPCADDLAPFERLPDEDVSPTSSMRTVIGKNKNYAAKLHSPIKIMKYSRTIGSNAIDHALEMSRRLEEVKLPGFGFLRETVGISFPSRPGKRSWGLIIREMTPFPYDNSLNVLLIPYFALYGKDKYNPEEVPLLKKLIDESGCDPVQFVLEQLMFPVIRFFIYILVEHGLLLEPHAQNSLFTYNGKILRYIFRDLDLKVYTPVWKRLGNSTDNLRSEFMTDEPSEHRPVGCNVSLKYDRSMGKLLFDHLANCMEEYYQVPSSILEDKCKAYFTDLLPNYREYFPEVAYDLGEMKEGSYYSELLTTPPRWRPA